MMNSRKPLTHLIEKWENVACGGTTSEANGTAAGDDRCPPRTGAPPSIVGAAQPTPPKPSRADQTTKNVPDENVEILLVERPVTPSPTLAPRRKAKDKAGACDFNKDKSRRDVIPVTEASEIENVVRRILRTELGSKDVGTALQGLTKLSNGCGVGGRPAPPDVDPEVKDRYEQVVRDYTSSVVKMNGDFLVLQAMQQHGQCVEVQATGFRVLARLTGGRCEETARAVASVISNLPAGFTFLLRVMRDFIDCEELQLAALATILNVLLFDDTRSVGLMTAGLITTVLEILSHYPDQKLIQRCGCNILCLPDNDPWLRAVADASGGMSCVLHGLRTELEDVSLLFNGLGVLVHCCDKCDSGPSIIDGDGMSAIVAVMDHHADDAGLQLAGLEALCLVAEIDYETSLPRLVQSGGILATVRAMLVCADQADVQYNGCSLLSVLCRTQPYRSFVGLAGGRMAASAALNACKHDAEVQCRARQVMEMLSTP